MNTKDLNIIRTEHEINAIIFAVDGGWVKRRNLRAKLVDATNRLINERIDALRKEIRKLKAEGKKERDLIGMYSQITMLEIRKI
ncbi:coil containing protein [Vibrio phage 1.165.O._10N.261.51.B7]|nr:coil containing protein [Vibrio phage 1.165.O._10N.261.51.B7]AUR96570.1 coil containing protein [Vibrio phage 1.226.O._10N.261.48.E5]